MSPTDLHLRRLPMPDDGPRLGRHVEHDPRSRQHDVTARLKARTIRPVSWPRISPIFDQGSLGSCVGMAMAGWLGSAPHCGDPLMFRENEAVWLYNGATRLDAFTGEHPPTDTGSSGIGGCKAARMLGMIRGWSTAFTTDAMLQALQVGPVLVGSVWTDDMFTPDMAGEVRPTGQVAGGHEYLVRGWDGTHLLCDNSWGTGWGYGGRFTLSLESWEILRAQDADVTVPYV